MLSFCAAKNQRYFKLIRPETVNGWPALDDAVDGGGGGAGRAERLGVRGGLPDLEPAHQDREEDDHQRLRAVLGLLCS